MGRSNTAFQNDTIVKVKGGVIVKLGNLSQNQKGEGDRGNEEVPDADRRLMRVNTSLRYPHLVSNANHLQIYYWFKLLEHLCSPRNVIGLANPRGSLSYLSASRI